jgi:hypothetical protein
MAPQTPSVGQGNRPGREPRYDVHPQTGATIEVFYADRSMETFGRCGAGWFWCSRQRGSAPSGPAAGPFSTSYSAYRDGMKSSDLSALFGTRSNFASDKMIGHTGVKKQFVRGKVAHFCFHIASTEKCHGSKDRDKLKKCS